MNSTPAQTAVVPKHLSPWRVLWLGTLIMVFVELVGIFCGATIGGLGTFFILLFGGFFVFGVSLKFIGDWAGAPVAGAFLVTVMIAFGNAAQPIWLAITGEGQNATVVEVPNGIIRSEFGGYYSFDGYVSTRTGGRGYPARTEYMVAPLVDETWTPEDEVKVWVVCKDTWDLNTDFSDIDVCLKKWTKNYSGGYGVEPGEEGDVGQAVNNAMIAYNLDSSYSAKYVYSSSNPKFEVALMFNFGIGLLIFTHLVYIASVLVKWRKIKTTLLP
ncbi:MAG: hypothetical protein AAB373_06685 [Patescibacteria group bacterium]